MRTLPRILTTDFNVARCGFFLGRQSRLLGLAFEGDEVGIGIASEAGSCDARLSPLVEGSAQVLPPCAIDPAKIASGQDLSPRADAGHEPDRPTQHRSGRGCLAPGGAALVVALRAEQLLQGIVGAGQAGHVGHVEQSGPIAPCHLAEVVEGRAEINHAPTVTLHRGEQAVKAPPDLGARLPGGIGQQAGGSVHEDEALLHGRPERGGAGERPVDQEREPRERARGPPFERTRSRLPATFSRRPFNRSPAASSGARPSSVIALRTALA